MVISAKSLKNPKYLSGIISKLSSYINDNDSIVTSSTLRLPKLDETLDEESLEGALDEIKKKK